MKCKINKPVILIVGTRPEGIKMVPVYKALKKAGIPTKLCSTMQHDGLLQQVLDLFEVKQDFNLDIMRQGQDLFYLTQSVLQKTKEIFLSENPSIVLVQGDTTSTMAAALSAFYLGIPVGHVEAGLRTNDVNQPFPEEMNRRSVSITAQYHFSPTAQSTANLLSQGIKQENVFCTGNTVIDALRIMREKIKTGKISIRNEIKRIVEEHTKNNQKIILLTTHRRESFNGGIYRILKSVKKFLVANPNVFCIYPFHPNPHVIDAIEKAKLNDLQNIFMCEPIEYKELIYTLSHSHFIITDSGGIQEEAVSLGKPVLILREKTEREEGIWAGLAKIVGTDEKRIIEKAQELINQDQQHLSTNVYGDGYASEKIVEIIKHKLETSEINSLNKKSDSTLQEINPAKVAIINKKEELNMKKVCVLGLGYIGLPTSIILAESGFDVIGFDIDEHKVKKINYGDPIIQEPDIYEKLQIVLKTKKLKATTRLKEADYFVIAVPTPFKENKTADLSYVYKAASDISSVLQKGNVILLESTVPVGTTENIAKFLEEKTDLKAGKNFFVAHCPERVLPGKIFQEIIQNDRIVGGINTESSEKAKSFYKKFVKGSIHITNASSSEMVKLIENSSRDTQIAFAHEVSAMASSIGLNPYEIINLANKHPRVNILQPSCGVGGHCIAVDPWFLVESFPDSSQLIKTSRQINDQRPVEVIEVIEKTATEWKIKNSKKPTVLLLGITYKPNVDDLRESPALLIAKQLFNKKHMDILISEPHIKSKKLKELFGNKHISTQDGIQKADIIVYLVAHKRFKIINTQLLKNKIIVDFCGIHYKEEYKKHKDNVLPENGILDFFIVNNKKAYYKEDSQ